jgi:Uri superfamily endonuclease
LSKEDNSIPPLGLGTYTLIIRVPKASEITVGALGVRHFQSGLYIYTGSALGAAQNLRARIARHMRTEKRRRWHIDYLLDVAEIIAVVFCVSPRRLECAVVDALYKQGSVGVPVMRFGSSDCRSCASHLYHHLSDNPFLIVDTVGKAYMSLGVVPKVFYV